MSVLAVILGIIEIIGDIIIFFKLSPALTGFGNFLLFIIMVIIFIISVVPLWHVGEMKGKIKSLEEKVDILAQIVQNPSKNSTPENLTALTHKEYRPFWNFESSPKKQPDKKTVDSSEEWTCPNCKKVHKLYITTCPCGTEQPDTFKT